MRGARLVRRSAPDSESLGQGETIVIRMAGINPFILTTTALLAIGAQVASASQVTFTDRTTFLGSVTGAANFDFETASGFPTAVAPLPSFAAGQVNTTTTGG